MSATQEWLAEFDHLQDHSKAGLEALNDLGGLSQRARTLLLPILTEAFLMYRRAEDRRGERRIPIESVYSGETSLEQRRERLSQTFPLPDGRRVSWEEATEQDHLDRISYLERHIAGVRRTIESHESAIALIREQGVVCLADIEDAA